MGFDDLVNQGREAFEQNKDKLQDALRSAKAEDVSDTVLDKVAEFAKGVLPDDMDEKVDQIRNDVDGAVGDR
ncbi:Rv0909 family putative TA system antitoxin [Microbacterium sp. JZ31]|uniref:Rv0909 family putative TA system antitoxin n=1 Tax=Microbacterium sp. JZ31 TaxID=1906274 RepID=UPI001932162D|nr:Rv0909 family putative TA system antitoxin [Microbacterium sp. JZ31]